MKHAILLLALACTSAARVIPTPQSIEHTSGAVELVRGQPVTLVLGNKPSQQTEMAAALLDHEFTGVMLRRSSEKPASGVSIFLQDCGNSRCPGAESVLDPARYWGQSYVLETRGQEIHIAGATGIGLLYGAATLAQLVVATPDGWRVPGVRIRDYPSFRFRAASDWLLRAELNRWAYDWGDGIQGYATRIRRKLDFCVRFKINMVMFDGFGWSAARRPGYAALMRELNAYARERGIKLMFAGFGANFDPAKVEPEFHIGRILLNRRSYPDGPVYSCFGEARTAGHPTYGTCRSNQALQSEIARDFEEFVRAVEPGALYVHHEDTGHYETTQKRWSARCEECKRRWPNPDFAAADGGAGAMAHGYANILEAVNRVRNTDSGYEAARDCTVVFISPPYGVDSQRSGMGSQKIDPGLNWNKTLDFWANAVEAMPRATNFSVGFREIFAGPGGRQWLPTYGERMRARGLNSNVFLFFLGGADQYSNGFFNDPATGSPVMNALFEGAQTIYNFNGGLHQEPQQVINAEYSWNSRAPGYLAPSSFAEGLKRWHALMKNEEQPEVIFGSEGLLGEACRRIYGARAGTAMVRFFSLHQNRETTTLPEFYPSRVYPTVVLWRFLQGDSAYWEIAPSLVEQRALAALTVSRAELQQRLAGLWQQIANVNRQAEPLLESVFEAGDLRADAREDVERVRLSLLAGGRLATLVAAHHTLLSGQGNRQDVLRAAHDASKWLRSQTRFDFTDPKGGDASSWSEAVEGIRARLLEVKQ